MRDQYKKGRGARPYGKCKQCRYDAQSREYARGVRSVRIMT